MSLRRLFAEQKRVADYKSALKWSKALRRLNAHPKAHEFVERIRRRGVTPARAVRLLLEVSDYPAAAELDWVRERLRRSRNLDALAKRISGLVPRLRELPMLEWLSVLDRDLLRNIAGNNRRYGARLKPFLRNHLLPRLVTDARRGSVLATRVPVSVRFRDGSHRLECPDVIELLAALGPYIRKHGTLLAAFPSEFPRINKDNSLRPKRKLDQKTFEQVYVVSRIHRRLRGLLKGRRAPNIETALLAGILLDRPIQANSIAQLHRGSRRHYHREE